MYPWEGSENGKGVIEVTSNGRRVHKLERWALTGEVATDERRGQWQEKGKRGERSTIIGERLKVMGELNSTIDWEADSERWTVKDKVIKVRQEEGYSHVPHMPQYTIYHASNLLSFLSYNIMHATEHFIVALPHMRVWGGAWCTNCFSSGAQQCKVRKPLL